ncbi:MAG: diguanylate cyclase [Acidobacteriota bacterium]
MGTAERKPRILLIDDDPDLLKMLEMGLGPDYEVVTTSHPRQGLEVFAQGDFDLVITDVVMPELSGFEVMRKVKEASELTEVILLTGKEPHRIKMAVNALQDGAHDYLMKPVRLRDLKATVRKALEKQRLRMEDKRALHELIRMAHTDYLTGLSNRNHFCSQLKLEFERSKRHGRSLGCVVFDVDKYKRVNDEYGHGCGDWVLQRLAAVIKRNCRITDLKCRYGGDEFILILPETGQSGTVALAEKLRCLIEDQVFDFLDRPLRITISLGAAVYADANLRSPEELVHRADTALLAAKREGGNRIRFFDDQCPLHPFPVRSFEVTESSPAAYRIPNEFDTLGR